jgi:hypothetical protein
MVLRPQSRMSAIWRIDLPSSRSRRTRARRRAIWRSLALRSGITTVLPQDVGTVLTRFDHCLQRGELQGIRG